MSERDFLDGRRRLVRTFFLAGFLVVLYQLLRLFSPFYLAVLGSAVVALLVHPVYVRLRSRLPGRNAAAAAATVFGLLCIVLPSLFFGWAFLKDAARLYPAVRDWLESLRALERGGRLLPDNRWLEGARRLLALGNVDLEALALRALAELRVLVMETAAAALTNALFVLFDLVLLGFTLFFFLRDGEQIVRWLVDLVPMSAVNKETILARLRATLLGLVRGLFGLAIVQGALTGLGLAVIGIPFPALLGMLTTVLAPIPFLGALGVLATVALAMLLASGTLPALLAAAWRFAAALIVERGLRPLLPGPHNEVPVLLLFFGLLGGLRVYGPAGALLGPLLIALTLAFVKIYREEYRWLLDPDAA